RFPERPKASPPNHKDISILQYGGALARTSLGHAAGRVPSSRLSESGKNRQGGQPQEAKDKSRSGHCKLLWKVCDTREPLGKTGEACSEKLAWHAHGGDRQTADLL